MARLSPVQPAQCEPLHGLLSPRPLTQSLTNRPHLSDPSSPPRSRPATASAIPAGDPLPDPHAVIPGLPFYLVPRDPALFSHPPHFCPEQCHSSASPWNRHHAAAPPRQVPTLAPHRRPEGHQPLVRDFEARLLGNSTGPVSSEHRRPMIPCYWRASAPFTCLVPLQDRRATFHRSSMPMEASTRPLLALHRPAEPEPPCHRELHALSLL